MKKVPFSVFTLPCVSNLLKHLRIDIVLQTRIMAPYGKNTVPPRRPEGRYQRDYQGIRSTQ